MERDKDKGIASFFVVIGIIMVITGLIFFFVNKWISQNEIISMIFGISFMVSGSLITAFCIYIIRVIDNLYSNIKFLEREIYDLRKQIKEITD